MEGLGADEGGVAPLILKNTDRITVAASSLARADWSSAVAIVLKVILGAGSLLYCHHTLSPTTLKIPHPIFKSPYQFLAEVGSFG